MYHSPASHCELPGYSVKSPNSTEEYLQGGFWRSEKPFRITRKLTTKDLNQMCRQAAHHLDLFDDLGLPVGVGAFPSKDPFTAAVAAVGRQCFGKTGNRKYVHDFRTISRFYARKIMTELNGKINSFGPADRLTRIEFDLLLKSIPPAKRQAVWEAMEGQLHGLPRSVWQKAGAFNKLECCLKSMAPTVKPRSIVSMPLRMYIESIHCLTAQELIYSCPCVERWMIKHCDAAAVFNKVREIYDAVHVSQDISGFENALLPEMRLVEQIVLPGVLQMMGFAGEARTVRSFMGRTREIKTPYMRYDVNVRCSGDFWTSLGNGLINICLILTGDYVAKGRPALCAWWGKARNLKFITEGDDAILPAALQNREVTRGLRMEFSLFSLADQPGGADFLKVTYHPIFDEKGVYQGRLGNTLRWARGLTFVFGENLKMSKRLSLLRAKAWSVHHLQPGHPMTAALVYLIGKMTSGHTGFSGWEKHLSKWNFDFSKIDISKPIPYIEPSSGLRTALATSRCPDLPRITVDDQLEFERQCLEWKGGKILFPECWKRYPEWPSMCAGRVYLEQRPLFSNWTSRVAERFFRRHWL